MQKNISDIYCKLDTVDSYSQDLTSQIFSRNDWFSSNGFDILKIDLSFFKDSKLFPVIKQYNAVPLIFKMNPMTWYDWHTDSTRQCAINMLLTGFNSHCFFGDRENRDIVNLTELKYDSDCYYLLNTQEKHAVLNFNETRYLLSIGFNSPNTYSNILQTCKEYKL